MFRLYNYSPSLLGASLSPVSPSIDFYSYYYPFLASSECLGSSVTNLSNSVPSSGGDTVFR